MNIELTDTFKKSFKRLSKKFWSLTSELETLVESLESMPKQGVDLGNGLYKIRLASASKGTGKSGGFRVITYYLEQTEQGETVYLLIIYDKSQESSIHKNSLLKLLKKI
jgi:hypothetical protein